MRGQRLQTGTRFMNINELPIEAQQWIERRRVAIANKVINTPYEIELCNATGTRYFLAMRRQAAWWDDKGHYLPFGGGSQWDIRYGVINWRRCKNPLGEWEYDINYGKCYAKSQNGTVIPTTLKTKKEVIELAKAIGIFNI